MTDPIVALHQLAVDIADDVRALAAEKARAASLAAAQPKLVPPRRDPPPAVLVRALANIDSLVTQVRNNPTLLGAARSSSVENLEAHYGNVLGRIIALAAGLPLANLARSNAIARLLATDTAARAELTHIDPNDGELIETLFDLFAGQSAVTAARSAARPAPDTRRETGAQSGQSTDHMAQLIAERAQYVIPSIIPPPAIADIAVEPEDEEDVHVDRVRRVEAIDKAKRQK